MLLRYFYVQENEKAPVPRSKKVRELKTGILPLELRKYVGESKCSRQELIDAYGVENEWIYEANDDLLVQC